MAGNVLYPRYQDIIQQHVAPGTVVWSDEWAAYNHMAFLPNVSNHDVVNHSVEFVSPSGVHTQNVESYWNRIKIKLKKDARVS